MKAAQTLLHNFSPAGSFSVKVLLHISLEDTVKIIVIKGVILERKT